MSKTENKRNLSKFLDRYRRLKLPELEEREKTWARVSSHAHNHNVDHLNVREAVDFLAMMGLMAVVLAHSSNGDLGLVNPIVDGLLSNLKLVGIEMKLQQMLQVSPLVIVLGAVRETFEVTACFLERRRLDGERESLRILADWSVRSRIN